MALETISGSITILASILSIAASVKQIAAQRHISRGEALKAYLQSAGDDEVQLLERPDIVDSVLEITTISGKLLDQLAKEAQGCEDRHVRARKKAEKENSQLDKQLANTKAAECMCQVLRDIMIHNGKKLPKNGPFEDWWGSYNCQA